MKPKIKGDLFEKTFTYIKGKKGEMGLENLSFDEEDFPEGGWFPLSIYCALLKEMYEKLMDEDISDLYRMGYNMINDDERWKSVFKDKDPHDIFTTNKRQDEQYKVGRTESRVIDEGHIRIRLDMETTDPLYVELWTELYLGRIQAVLDVSGYEGKIEKHIDDERGNNICYYDIRWG